MSEESLSMEKRENPLILKTNMLTDSYYLVRRLTCFEDKE